MSACKTIVILLAGTAIAVAATLLPPNEWAGRVQNGVLATTAVAIFWYSYETMQLRTEARTANRIAVRPILFPKFFELKTQINRVAIHLKNEGRGAAHNIRWRIETNEGGVAAANVFDTVEGELPQLWPTTGYRLAAFKTSGYTEKRVFDLRLRITYSWEFGKDEETFSLDLEKYVSTDMSPHLLEGLQGARGQRDLENRMQSLEQRGRAQAS